MRFLVLTLGLTLASPLAFADRILGIHGGVGYWLGDYSGELGEPSISASDLDLDDSDNSYIYLALEHPIPLVPNIRAQYNQINSDQTTTISQDFSLDGVTFTAGDEVLSELELNHVDVTLYYQLLDNWINLDLGLTARKFDGFAFAQNDAISQEVDLDAVVPMVYGMAQFDLPFTGWSLGAEGNAFSFDDNELTDYSVRLRYMLQSVLDLGVELGYREMSLELDGRAQTDLDLDGIYGALVFHF